MSNRDRDIKPPKRGPGRPRLSPGEPTVVIRVPVPASKARQARAVAAARGWGIAEVMRDALELWLETPDRAPLPQRAGGGSPR